MPSHCSLGKSSCLRQIASLIGESKAEDEANVGDTAYLGKEDGLDSLSFMAWEKAALMTFSEDMLIRRSQSQSLCSPRRVVLSLASGITLNRIDRSSLPSSTSSGVKPTKKSGRNLREKPLSYRKKEGAARPGKRSTLWLRGMDSPIDESDLGSLSHRRTSLEVEREGNRKGSPSLCLLLAAFLVHPALRRLQIQLQADGEYAAEQPQGLPAVIAELTRWAAQNLELTLKSEINVGPRLSEEGRLKRRSRKCNTTRGEPKACAKEEANQSEWRQGGEKRKIEQCKGERSCPLFSGNPPPHMSKKRERGRKNNHFTLAHEVAGLASAYSLSINKMRNGGERKRSLLKRLCTRNRTNADPEEWVWAFEKMNMQRVRADGDSRTGKSGTRHLLNKTKNKAIPCPREKLVMIAMNAALEDVYKKVFADSYQHGTDSEKEEAWHEIGGGRISDSELLDSMDGGRALQLKHEINVESTIIQRGTTKRDRDQPLVYRVPNLRFFKYPIPEEFQPLLPLGRVSLLSELAGREDQLINMNLESGWLIAASLYWRLSGRGGACYRNLFPGVNLVRSILREKKDGNEWEDWSSLFISRKELVSTSLIRRTNKKRLTV
ncbi:hypothetical protein Tco_1068844 [Tanacetum coccineum]|uniref:Uncharacterized protein n=3 Tax=Tanacetum coccineum TaxID=301880 RepID=A0ABQ5HIQ8_9ASTR